MFLDLHLVQIGDLSLDLTNRLCLIHALHMDVDRNGIVHAEKVRHEVVLDFRGKNLNVGNGSDALSHAEVSRITEVKACRCDKVLCGKSGSCHHVIVEYKRIFRVLIHHLIEQLQPFKPGKRICRYPHHLQFIDDVRLDPFQSRLGCPDAVRLDAKGNVLVPDKSVVSFGELCFKYSDIFISDRIELISLKRNIDLFLSFRRIGIMGDAADLKEDARIKVVIEVTPALEGCRFVFVLRQLIIDITEAQRLVVQRVCHPADPVLVDFLVDDGILAGLRDIAVFLFFQFLFYDPLFLLTGEDRSGLGIGIYLSLNISRFSFCRLFAVPFEQLSHQIQYRAPPFRISHPESPCTYSLSCRP